MRVLIAVMFVMIAVSGEAAQRTFVSTTGSDASPCSLTQPCRSFATAISKTNASGEVVVLDSGGYGPVTVSSAVTITAPVGVHAGISVTTGNGINVAAGAGDAVTLRGLYIVHQGGDNGIRFASGSLIIERCTISGAFNYGLFIQSEDSSDMLLIDSHISHANTAVGAVDWVGFRLLRLSVVNSSLTNVNHGIVTRNRVDLLVENSRVIGNGASFSLSGSGIQVYADDQTHPVNAHIANSVIRGFYAGVTSYAEHPYASTSVVNSELSHNRFAVTAWFGTGSVALSNNRIVHNYKGAHVVPAGVLFTSGNNYFAYNESADDAMLGPGGLK